MVSAARAGSGRAGPPFAMVGGPSGAKGGTLGERIGGGTLDRRRLPTKARVRHLRAPRWHGGTRPPRLLSLPHVRRGAPPPRRSTLGHTVGNGAFTRSLR